MKPSLPIQAEPTKCRLCGSQQLQDLGAIPDSDYFAGQILPQPIAGGRLWRCRTCESMFRHPVLMPSAYLDLYARSAADEWTADDRRHDLAIIREMVARESSPSVLDVGCGAGDFLLTLPPGTRMWGIEPSKAAATVAQERGISILGPTLAALRPDTSFDIITIIDVVEHVADPGTLLDQAVAHLAPGGSLIISTGDSGIALWRRVFRSRFWYAGFPEHITFPAFRYFQMWHESKGLCAPTALRFKYRRMPLWRVALHLATQAAYLLNPGILSWAARSIDWLRRAPMPRRHFFSPGAPGVFTDHQIVTFRRIP